MYGVSSQSVGVRPPGGGQTKPRLGDNLRPSPGGRVELPRFIEKIRYGGYMGERNGRSIKGEIKGLADQYADMLRSKVDERVIKMKSDDTSHFLIYRVLGISDDEGMRIDIYQNKGRFLYQYAGAFLERAAKLCFRYKYPESGAIRIPNTEGRRPATFEIDCAIDSEAIEIKWRDATTDGDHITKEHTRIKTIHHAGYIPIRVMFYYPNREQAIKIQKTLETLYHGLKGQYYYGDFAWGYLRQKTGIDLKNILEELAVDRMALK